MTSLNGNIFRVTGPSLYGNSPFTDEFPSQRSETRNFDVFFDRRLNKRLSKQSKRRWFETPSHSLWRHCYGLSPYGHLNITYTHAVLWAIELVTGIELQWIWIKVQWISFKKTRFKMSFAKCLQFCPGLIVLTPALRMKTTDRLWGICTEACYVINKTITLRVLRT